MAEPVTLRDEDIGRVGEYVKPWIRELVDRMVPRPATIGADNQLLERIVRVEEELKAQRELLGERFEAVDRRFEAVDKRFEAADKRFEELALQMNTRFSTLTWMIGIGFVVVTTLTTVFALLA